MLSEFSLLLPVAYWAHELPLRHIEGKPKEKLKNLIYNIKIFDAESAKVFSETMERLLEFAHSPEAANQRIFERVQKFLCEFESDFKLKNMRLQRMRLLSCIGENAK